MLVLSRDIGEEIVIGGTTTVEVIDLGPGTCTLKVGTEIRTLKVDEIWRLSDSICLVVKRIQTKRVRIGVNAPREISVFRKEVIGRS